MNEDLRKIREEIEFAHKVQQDYNEHQENELKAFWAREETLLPEKLEMSNSIFHWGRELLASEDYQYIRNLGICQSGMRGLEVFCSSKWGNEDQEGAGCHSRLVLEDDCVFQYTKHAKWITLKGFMISDPEMMAESLVHSYLCEVHETAKKGVDHAISRIIKFRRWEIQKRIEEAPEVEG